MVFINFIAMAMWEYCQIPQTVNVFIFVTLTKLYMNVVIEKNCLMLNS